MLILSLFKAHAMVPKICCRLSVQIEVKFLLRGSIFEIDQIKSLINMSLTTPKMNKWCKFKISDNVNNSASCIEIQYAL